jgi:hypothetical protein
MRGRPYSKGEGHQKGHCHGAQGLRFVDGRVARAGRNNFITFEIHGDKGSIAFNYERMDEL